MLPLWKSLSKLYIYILPPDSLVYRCICDGSRMNERMDERTNSADFTLFNPFWPRKWSQIPVSLIDASRNCIWQACSMRLADPTSTLSKQRSVNWNSASLHSLCKVQLEISSPSFRTKITSHPSLTRPLRSWSYLVSILSSLNEGLQAGLPTNRRRNCRMILKMAKTREPPLNRSLHEGLQTRGTCMHRCGSQILRLEASSPDRYDYCRADRQVFVLAGREGAVSRFQSTFVQLPPYRIEIRVAASKHGSWGAA